MVRKGETYEGLGWAARVLETVLSILFVQLRSVPLVVIVKIFNDRVNRGSSSVSQAAWFVGSHPTSTWRFVKEGYP